MLVPSNEREWKEENPNLETLSRNVVDGCFDAHKRGDHGHVQQFKMVRTWSMIKVCFLTLPIINRAGYGHMV